jgi:hypothetical protein
MSHSGMLSLSCWLCVSDIAIILGIIGVSLARKTVIINDVGTSYVQQELLGFPDSFRIKRVIAQKISGSATEIAVRIKQRPDASPIADSVLEYALVPNLDYIEDFVVFPYRVKDTDFGTIYVAAKADTSGNKIKVIMEYSL